jgi:DNA-binding transcriptional regulator YiaG
MHAQSIHHDVFLTLAEYSLYDACCMITATDIKARRQALGLNQRELGERLGGITQNTVARWERDEVKPHPLLDLALKYLELTSENGKAQKSKKGK